MKGNIKAAVIITFFLVTCLWFFQESRDANSAEEKKQENQCFTCHTNPRKLIKITRQIAESKKGEPQASEEIEGEG